MSDNLQKLIEAARLLGLTAEKTPGGRYNFTNEAGERVHVAANLGKAVEYLTQLQAARKAPKAPKAAARPVPAQLVNEFRGMKNGKERASLLRQLVADHGRQQVMADLGISAPTLDEQVRSIRLYETSKVIKGLHDKGQLSWSKIVSKISVMMRQGLEHQERIAADMVRESIENTRTASA